MVGLEGRPGVVGLEDGGGVAIMVGGPTVAVLMGLEEHAGAVDIDEGVEELGVVVSDGGWEVEVGAG